jgi:hypothetical protein
LILTKQRLFLVSSGRSHAGCTIQQLGSEQFIAQPTLRFEHPAMPPASRTRHRAAQQARVLGSYPQIKAGSAAGVLTYGSVYDTRPFGRFVFSAHRGLHNAISFLRLQVLLGRAVQLDVKDLEKFQASDVPELMRGPILEKSF